MQDFIRIGGPVTSSPLNENFRRLLNAISIANTNLVYSETDGIVNTIEDMMALIESGNLIDGQVCYVISSGQLYRWSAGDNKWYLIMDIGGTFRQGFLNSGLVLMNGEMTADLDTITIPDMLVYFKNKEGDGRYLKGMYLIPESTISISSTTGGAYSIFVDYEGNFSITSGMPSTDDPDNVFMGTYIVNQGRVYKVYTLPDIAYTADRGYFLLNGGQASGLNLAAASGHDVSRADGYYYDEGINYSIGTTDDFPAITDNGSNFNLRYFDAEPTVEKLHYIYPRDSFTNPIIEANDGLLYNWYVNNGTKTQVPYGHFTIQRHLVTPDGEDFIVFGDEIYNSMDDALANINVPFSLDVEFPYAEASRIILGTDAEGNFDVEDPDLFRVETLSRLSQVGTFTPVFADSQFKIYSSLDDISPAIIRFNLKNLEDTNYYDVDGFNLAPLPLSNTRDIFSLSQKYIGRGINPQSMTQTIIENRTLWNSEDGYALADNRDVLDLKNRVADIETEIWAVQKANSELYEQSLRYRMSEAEYNITNALSGLNNKVDKTTTINGHALTSNIVLTTDDIGEGNTNLYYTDARVNNNSHVSTAYDHANVTGTGTVTNVNPHGMSTDDITTLINSNHQFVTLDELARIQNLPNDTTSQLNSKIGPIPVTRIEGDHNNVGASTFLGNITALNVYSNGARIEVNNGTGTLECVGQLTPENVLTKAEFATQAAERPDLYGGRVDRAIVADGVSILNTATENQYYGTNSAGTPGVFDLPVYVSTASAEEYLSVSEKQFVPIKQSVMLEHLANSKVSYPRASEEAKTGTNLYDLVTKHYHKVYNNETQGPYISGTQTQDTSGIYYSYKVPSNGLRSDTYYFSYNNDNFGFTTSAIAATKELIYTPSTNKLTLDGVEIVIAPVDPEEVVESKWLPFVSRTDWNNINEWNFGDNLTVTVNNGRATINATVAGTGQSNFVNLGDVALEYNDSNLGKMVTLDKINGNYKLVWSAANLAGYMREIDFVGQSATRSVALADLATTATSANTLQNTYTVSDGTTSATTLWTSSKVVTELNKVVKTYSGTTEPTSSLGKDGDIYILLEEEL